MTQGISKPLIVFAVGATVFAGIGCYSWFESSRSSIMEVYIFDTNGLPSIFIRTPEDVRILIGGGSNAGIVRHLTEILPFYSRRIDMIIVPDTDSRNITGLIEVINRYSVAKVIVPKATLNSIGLVNVIDPIYKSFTDFLNKQKGSINVEEYSVGSTFNLGSVKFDVLFPARAEGFVYSKSSPPSLCGRVSYKDVSLMLLGVSGTKVQRYLASSTSTPSDKIRSSVLIVSHSVVPGSLVESFFKRVNPKYLVYSQAINNTKNNTKKENTSITKTKGDVKKEDPLIGMLKDSRFNIKEKGLVKITSDGYFLNLSKEL